MTLRTHELHPSLVHMPLTILPAAAIVETLAARARGPRRWVLNRAGRALWWATTGSALLAGLAGMAASQEIDVRSDHARDQMFLHGIGNLGLVLSALGVAVWRTRHRASVATAGLGLGAVAAGIYTAYLGGELVYRHGAGVKVLGGFTAEQPALFSRAGAKTLGKDAGRGLAWLLRRTGRAVTAREKARRGAAAVGEAASAAH
jgi:uncharacterized membrane protein